MSSINFLPPWVETNLQPAFYDKESGTCLQQTARMYNKVNELVRSVNTQNETIADYIEQFIDLRNYVEDYFDNLDVEQEINNKIDSMVESGEFQTILDNYVQPKLNLLDAKIDTNTSRLQSEIGSLASGSPIPVSSTSQMTNQNKIYVNTTDGKWYYYNTGTSTWTAGGTYQSTGIEASSVNVSSLNDKLRNSIYYKSSDVSKLGLITGGYNSAVTRLNCTTPMLILAGTTITFSSDFVENYHWGIKRIVSGGVNTGTADANFLKPESTDTTYQFANDELCVITWRPIDNNWETDDYTVDPLHKLDSNDLTSITFYYNFTDIRVPDPFVNSSFMLRSLEVGVPRFNSYFRYGNTIPLKFPCKSIVTCKDNQFNYAVVTVETVSGSGFYHQTSDTGWLGTGSIEVEANTLYFINVKRTDNGAMNSNAYQAVLAQAFDVTIYPTYEYVDDIVTRIPTIFPEYDKFVKGINHRGYNTIAPENTIPAFKLSAEKGFKYVECDVEFTSDDVAVILHDTTIDRTSNGTGAIASMTYEQALQYDFGSWKSAEYTGTKIPTLDQFLKCCKDCDLTPYIELKSNISYSDTQYSIILNAVKKYGMQGKVTYISFSYSILQAIHQKDPNARLGYLSSPTTEAISNALAIKNNNEVFIDSNHTLLTSDNVQACMNAGLPLEIWTVDTESTITNMNNYVTGVTSNNLIAGKVLFDNALDD